MENIAVIDWFTKKREVINYPDDSDIKLDELIKRIIEKFKGENLDQIADSIYEILRQSNFYNQICSDLKLPICSLFHHSKNTSAIAVCLATQASNMSDFKSNCLSQYEISNDISSNYSENDFKALIRIASLLHDIGKPRSRTSRANGLQYHEYVTQTEEILTQIIEKVSKDIISKYELNKILPKLAAKNHPFESKTILEELIDNADSIASAADKIYEVKGNFENNSICVESKDRIFPHEINFSEGLQCLDSQNSEVIGFQGKVLKNVTIKSNDETLLLFKDSVVEGGLTHNSGQGAQILQDICLLALDIMKIQEYINEADELPMLRGGSTIVDEILEETFKIISKEICPEAVLFRGGGNLLAFMPSNNATVQKIKRQINKSIEEKSEGGLEAAVVTKKVQINDLTQFSKVLEVLQDKIEKEKNISKTKKIIRPKNREDVCQSCFKRKVNVYHKKICDVCNKKESSGHSEKHEKENKYLDYKLMKKFGLKRPYQLQDIGDSIAVIAIDGNMMGRFFLQTMTPAEYNFKSETFDTNFKNEVIETIEKFIENKETRDLIEHNDFAGIDPLYIGGDDVLLILNSKGAIKFCELLINNIYERFKFSKKFGNGTTYSNPTVTISCGIAIADAKFPIYFLLEAARKMESKAKEGFRNETETDYLNLIKLPKGSIAFTAVSGAMPSEENVCFMLPKHENELSVLNNLIVKSLKIENRPNISSLINLGKTFHERINFLKSIYSSGLRKQSNPSEWLDDCMWMVQIMNNKDLLSSAKMIIPQIWHKKEEL